MSIVTLKNKYKAKQNLSSQAEGFSLKGTLRNIKGIGTNRPNSEVRTIFKGTFPTGYGGNSTYNTSSLPRTCGYTNTSTPTSTMTTKGLLLSKVYHPTRTASNYLGTSGCSNEGTSPTWWVKDFNPLSKSQSEYINKFKIECVVTEKDSPTDLTCLDPCQTAYYIGTRKMLKSTYYNSDVNGAITSGEFTSVNLLRNNCLPTPPCKHSFPLVLNKQGCNTEYKTPEEAQNAGLLPADWMKCSTYPVYTKNPYIS